jgi:hypothetical protein
MRIEITMTAKPSAAGERALEQLLALDGKAVRAGLFDPELATRGAVHEFGAGNIPARPWASTAADTGAQALGQAAAKAVGAVADGKLTAHGALDVLGRTEAEQLREIILAGRVPGPALADSTIKRKGHSTKLLDSGDMVSAITHEIGRQEADR